MSGPESRSPPAQSLPWVFRLIAGGTLFFLLFFAATAPWRFGEREVGRFSAPLAFTVLALSLWLMMASRARKLIAARFFWGSWSLSRRSIVVSGAVAALFLYFVVSNRYNGFEVNASDFSFYDRPLARPFENGFLYNSIESRSVFATHAYYVLLVFLPAYAIHPSPYWLLAAQTLGIAAAGMAAFYCFRILCRDDLAASLLAAAFLLNDFTAKAVQYVFHPEIFYPLCLFFLVRSFLARRPLAFAIALLATAAVKEDAVLPLSGFAVTASLFYRRHRWAAAAAAVGLTVFLLDYFVVLPHFAGQAGPPWYSNYWEKYGPSPLAAALGMLLRPVEVTSDLLRSGLWRLVGGLVFVPFFGFEWLLAAAAMIVPYGAAQHEKLAQFRLYYSMPVLPFLFAAAAVGLHRVVALKKAVPPAERRARYRVGALALLLVSAFYGPGYRFVPRQPTDVPRRFASAVGGRPLAVQGALLPHVGYSVNYAALLPPVKIDGSRGFLIAPSAIPFPFNRSELRRLGEELEQDPRFHTIVDRGILLAVPAAWDKTH